MGQGRVLVVTATHGNERNAPWLLEQWRARPELLNAAGVDLQLEIGNPDAFAANRRYLDRDLNRCFTPELLADASRAEREVQRARALLAAHGPDGEQPCGVALDLHSTTSTRPWPMPVLRLVAAPAWQRCSDAGDGDSSCGGERRPCWLELAMATANAGAWPR